MPEVVPAVSIAQHATCEDVQQAILIRKLWFLPLKTNNDHSRGMVIWSQVIVVISSNGPGLGAKQDLLQPDDVRVH